MQFTLSPRAETGVVASFRQICLRSGRYAAPTPPPRTFGRIHGYLEQLARQRLSASGNFRELLNELRRRPGHRAGLFPNVEGGQSALKARNGIFLRKF